MKHYYLVVLLLIIGRNFASAELKCKKGQSTTRHYNFTVEFFTTMGPACKTCPHDMSTCYDKQCVAADGVPRGIFTINRRMPGPTIEVCKGDRVVIDVHNHLIGMELAIHYHGQLQKGTQFEDGTPFVTQCPIHEGTSWRYDFVAQEDGTFFYHSHDGLQKMNGCFGKFIVRNPEDPHEDLYDYDIHSLVLQDWFHSLTENYFPGPVFLPQRGQIPSNLLINGRGLYINSAGESTGTPLSVLKVYRGKKYRLRIIHAGCMECPFQLQIQSHEMTLIATDGSPVKPVKVNTIILLPGERYDVVIHANRAARSYIIQLTALGECEGNGGVHQQALLCYKGGSCTNPPRNYQLLTLPNGIILNPMAAACADGTTGICVYQLESLEDNKCCGRSKHHSDVKKFLLYFNFYNYNYSEIFDGKYSKVYRPYYIPGEGTENSFLMQAGQINNISMVMASSPPLSQPEELKNVAKCHRDKSQHQNCFHMQRVKLGTTVDVILVHDSIGEEIESHPFHLHGYRFCVLYQGYSLAEAMRHDLPCKGAPLKDTVAVPGSGITKIRFVADNPGFWLLHCHILFHQVTGMQMILAVGDQNDMPSVPKNFPKCGNYNHCTNKNCFKVNES